jgi:aflatoxin B1 aldehyde reductase
VVIYNPIAGGLFSGKIKSVDDIPNDNSRFGSQNKHNAPNYRERYFRNSTFEALNIVEEAAKKANLTLIETALRWAVHHSALNVGQVGSKSDGIIIGVSSQEQLENNLRDLEKGPLPEEVVKAIDEAWMHVKGQAPVYWHGKLEYGYKQTDQYAK